MTMRTHDAAVTAARAELVAMHAADPFSFGACLVAVIVACWDAGDFVPIGAMEAKCAERYHATALPALLDAMARADVVEALMVDNHDECHTEWFIPLAVREDIRRLKVTGWLYSLTRAGA